jgi:predicted hotdog family 3-hydroxylacyl-ACP dehydratase
MVIGADQIRALIPHSGKMCLLERVLDWNQQSIRCQTSSHLDTDNPLRRNGRLSSICGIEYAAQAMAVHAALCSGSVVPTRHGYLASVREANYTSAFLDDHDAPLVVGADRVFADGSGVIYAFSIESEGNILISGRAAVRLSEQI